MRVPVVYAHHDPASFTHAVLQRVTEGLTDGGALCRGSKRALRWS